METLFTTLRLETAYSINNLQYHLRKWPLIKKLFKPSYEIQEWKLCFTILAFIRKLFIGLALNLLYFGILAFFAIVRNSDEDLVITASAGALFLVFLIFGSLVGANINNPILAADSNDYYAINQLRINARSYILSRFVYTLFFKLLFASLAMLIMCLFLRIPLWFVLIFPFFVMGLKFMGLAYRLFAYQRWGVLNTSTFSNAASIVLALICVAAGFIAMLANVTAPYLLIGCIMSGIGLIGCVAIVYVFKFDDYYLYYKRYAAQQEVLAAKATTKLSKVQSDKLDVKSANITSNKTGFAYMNELFLIRHHKVLMDTTKIITLIMAAVIVLAVGFIIFGNSGEEIRGQVIRVLPYLPFGFYMINRGSEYSAALFTNCDRSFLNYSFYRKRENILKLFTLRLIGISKQNLLPALTCGIGFVVIDVVSALSSGAPEAIVPLNLMLLFIAPICVSICFSVHYLMLYYLLQPFDKDSASKNPIYNIALGATYFICYMMYTFVGKLENLNPLLFAGILIAFCLVYSLLACTLVFAFAPKTFRNRR